MDSLFSLSPTTGNLVLEKLRLLTGDIIPQEETVVPWIGSSLLPGIGALWNLVSDGQKLGDAFMQSYSKLTGRNVNEDIQALFSSSNDQKPEETAQSLETIKEDISRAIAVAKAFYKDEIHMPSTCFNKTVTPCNEEQIKKWVEEIKTITTKMDESLCLLQGLQQDREKIENSINNCAYKLDKTNEDLKKQLPAPTPTSCPLSPPALPSGEQPLPSACPLQPPPPLTCPLQPPPPPTCPLQPPPPESCGSCGSCTKNIPLSVPTESPCGCGIKKKIIRRKRKKAPKEEDDDGTCPLEKLLIENGYGDLVPYNQGMPVPYNYNQGMMVPYDPRRRDTYDPYLGGFYEFS